MRLRDRRALLAALILTAAYGSLLLWAISTAGHFITRTQAPDISPLLTLLLWTNGALLLWRAAMRFSSVRKFYGTREGLYAVLRILPANIIAMMAARRALVQYWQLLRGQCAALGQDAPHLPGNRARRMNRKPGAPLRFLIGVIGIWVAGRGWFLSADDIGTPAIASYSDDRRQRGFRAITDGRRLVHVAALPGDISAHDCPAALCTRRGRGACGGRAALAGDRCSAPAGNGGAP